jgi:acyl carrier protein
MVMRPADHTAQIVAIAAEVFGRPARPEDDFYDLGGDSLNAVQFAARLQEWAGREIDVSLVTAAPDLASLARKLKGGE